MFESRHAVNSGARFCEHIELFAPSLFKHCDRVRCCDPPTRQILAGERNDLFYRYQLVGEGIWRYIDKARCARRAA